MKMRFKITYKNAEGKTACETIDAISRGDLFSKLKARSIQPLDVRECGVGGKNAPIDLLHKHFKAIIAFISMAIIIGISLLLSQKFCDRHVDDAGVAHSSGIIKNKRKAPPVSSTAIGQIPSIESEVNDEPMVEFRGSPTDVTPTNGWWRGLKVISTATTTNDLTGTIYERWQTEDGKFHSNMRSKPRIFKNPSDQMIVMLLASDDGTAMPPLPIGPMLDDAFEKSLEEPIVINDDDSVEIRTLKGIVLDARAQIAELMTQGLTPSEILMEHEREMRKQFNTRSDAMRSIAEIEREEGFDAAREYAEQVNQVLSSMGIASVPMPMTDEEREQAREERLQRRYER